MVHIAIHHRDYSHLARRGTMYPVTAALLCLGFGQTSGFVLRSGSQLVFNKGWKASKTASCRTAEETVPSMKLTEVPFRKYQGLGNDFILVDNRLADEPVLTPEESAHLCDRSEIYCASDCLVLECRGVQIESVLAYQYFKFERTACT